MMHMVVVKCEPAMAWVTALHAPLQAFGVRKKLPLTLGCVYLLLLGDARAPFVVHH